VRINDHYGYHEISYMQRRSYRDLIIAKAVRSQTHNLQGARPGISYLAY